VPPPPIRGEFRQFRVRTRPEDSAFISDWTISANTLRRNILATPPSIFTAAPEVYVGNQVTVSWANTIAGTSAIRQYVIQASTSTDNQLTWSAWNIVATVNSSQISGSATVNISTVARAFTRFRISVTDVLDGVSEFAFSNIVMRNSPPLAALVESPRAGAVTYNKYPICLIQTRPEPDGQPQTIWVNGANGEWYNSVDNSDLFTTPGATAAGIKTVFMFPKQPSEFWAGSHTITFIIKDSFSESPEVRRTFTVLDSPFENITANKTHVKAAHILTLREAINNVRNYYNMSNYVWANDIISGTTQVRDFPFHIQEIRSAIMGVVEKINSYADGQKVIPIEWLPIGNGRPRADVMEQLKKQKHITHISIAY
jgi:hypothetical protein